VLYELLTGKQAFRGEDLTEILAPRIESFPSSWGRRIFRRGRLLRRPSEESHPPEQSPIGKTQPITCRLVARIMRHL
jgi:hypothetical protein